MLVADGLGGDVGDGVGVMLGVAADSAPGEGLGVGVGVSPDVEFSAAPEVAVEAAVVGRCPSGEAVGGVSETIRTKSWPL